MRPDGPQADKQSNEKLRDRGLSAQRHRTVRGSRSTEGQQINLQSKKGSPADCPPFARGWSASQRKQTVNSTARSSSCRTSKARRGLSAVCKRTVRSSTETTEQRLGAAKARRADGPQTGD